MPIPIYEGDEKYVFVCYSHADKDLVYPELARLHDAGIRLWYDQGISPGSEWSDAIADRIDGCATFLYFVTPRSVASAYCRREVSFALETPRTVLAVHLVPTELPSGLRLLLNNLQAILHYDAASANYLPRLLEAVGSNNAPTPRRVDAVPHPTPAPSTPAGRVAVAVIPFRLRNGAREDQFLSVALADAVLHRLSGVGKLIVRPISSVLRYKDADSDWTQIARDLNVEIVVHGVVQMQGAKVRVLTEALRVADSEILHSSKHDGDLADLFGLQDRIADSISNVFVARQRAVAEPSTPPTKNPAAYELYLRAVDRMAYVDKFDTEIAIETLTRAVELDPNFADAWGRLAQATTGMGAHLDADPKWFEQAEIAIARTLVLDPVHCDALCARSMVLWSASRGFQNQAALRAINASLQINPRRDLALQFRGAILFHLGFYAQAMQDAEQSLLINPGYVLATTTRGMIAAYQGDYEASHDFYQRALRLNPVHLHASLFAPASLIYLGRLGEARESIRRARQILPEEPALTAAESLVLAHEGDFKNAEATADAALANRRSMTHTHHAWHDAAGTYALCGKADKAVFQLRRCAEIGLPNYALFQRDPNFLSLHGHVEFETLLTDLRRDRDRFQEEFGFA